MADLLPPVVAELRANITEFSAKMKEARGEMSQVESSGKSNFGAMKAAGVAAFAMLSAAAIKFGKDAIHDALEGQKAQANWVTAIKNSGQSVEDFVKKADKLSASFAKLGYTNDEMTVALTKLTQATNDPQKALQNIGLVADFAKARNIDLATAAGTLGKVLNGNVGVLRRLGIETKDAAGNTLTAEAAVKMLQERFGGAAQAQASTYAGKLQALSAQWSNFKETIGNALLPILTQLATILQVMLGWFTNLSPATQKLLSTMAVLAAGVFVAVKAFGLLKAAVAVLGIEINVALPELAALSAAVAGIVWVYNKLTGSSGPAKVNNESVARSIRDLGQAASDTQRILEDMQPFAAGKMGDPDQIRHIELVIKNLGLSADETSQLLANLHDPSKLFTDDMGKFSPRAQQAAQDLQNLADNAARMDTVVHNTNKSMDEAAVAAKDLGDGASGANSGLSVFSDGMDQVWQAAAKMANIVKNAYSEIRATFDKGFASDKALKEFRDGLKGLAEELKGLTAGSLDYKIVIEQQTDNALKAAEAFAEMDVANRGLSGSMADVARNQDMLKMLQQLRSETTNPDLQKSLDDMIEKLKKIPGTYNADININTHGSVPFIPIGGGVVWPKPRAVGGPVVSNDAYVVGEKGPELFIPQSSGTIVPHDKLQNNQTQQIIQNFYGITSDSDVARRASRELGWALRAA